MKAVKKSMKSALFAALSLAVAPFLSSPAAETSDLAFATGGSSVVDTRSAVVRYLETIFSSPTVVQSQYLGGKVVGTEVVLGKNYTEAMVFAGDLGEIEITLNGHSIHSSDGGPAIIIAGSSGIGAGNTIVKVAQFTVTFDRMDGDGGPEHTTADYGRMGLAITPPTRSGYVFQGYFSAKTGGTQYYDATGKGVRAWDQVGNTTLYAHWRKTLTAAMVSLSKDSATYTGSALTPTVTVKDGSALTQGTHYTLGAWSGACTAAGSYTVTVTGIGDYVGSVTKTFTVTQQVVTVPTAKPGLVYTGASQLCVNNVPSTTVATQTGHVPNQTTVNSYSATYSLKDTKNYKWSTGTTAAQTVTWSIAKAPLTATAVSWNNYEYGTKAPDYVCAYSGWKNGAELPTRAPVLTSTYTPKTPAGQKPDIVFSTEPVFANYAVTTVKGYVAVVKAPLTVTVTINGAANDSTSIAYGSAAPTFGVTYSDFRNDDTPATALTTQPKVTCPYKPKDATNGKVGTYTVSFSTYAAAGNYAITHVTHKFTVTQKALALPKAKTGLVYTGSSQLCVDNVPTEGASRANDDPNQKDAGSYSATFSLTDKTNYKWSDGTQTDKTVAWSVQQATLTVKANAKSEYVAYGAAAPGYTLEYGEWKGSDTAALVTTAPTAKTDYTTSKGVGTGTFFYVPSGGNALKNYAYDYRSGTGFQVKKAPLTATASSPSVTYGDAPPAYSCSYTGWASGKSAETPTQAPVLSSTYSKTTDVGADPAVTFTVKPIFANYEVTTVDGKVTVNKATLTATATIAGKADDTTVVQFDDKPAFGVSYSGWKNGQGEGVLTKKPTATSAYVAGDAEKGGIGTYTVTPAGGEAKNYQFRYVSHTFRVTQRVIQVPKAVSGLVYDGTEKTGVASAPAEGKAPQTGDAAKQTNAGTYRTTYTLKDTRNHKWSDDAPAAARTVEWWLGKAALTATASRHTVTYGDAAPEYGCAYTGWKNGAETPTTAAELTSKYAPTTAAGADPAVTFATVPVFENYAVTTVDGVVEVKKAKLTVTTTIDGKADDTVRIAFGDPAPKFGFDYSGWKNGDDESALTTKPTVKCGYVAGDPAHGQFGAYEAAPEGAAAVSYDFEYVPHSFQVAKKALPVPTAVAGLVYNGAEQTGVAGIPPADVAMQVPGTAAASQRNAGSYKTVYWLKDPTNYEWADGTGESQTVDWSVARRPAALSWSNRTFTYDGAPHKPGCAVANAAKGDDCTVTVAGEQTDAGEWTATATALAGASSANYALPDAATTTFTIAKSRQKPFKPGAADPEGEGYDIPLDVNDSGSLAGARPYSAFDCVTNYDGEAHTLDTNALVEAYAAACVFEPTVTYALDASAESWTADPYAFADAGATSVWYKVSVKNYEDFARVGRVVVRPRPVTLTSEDSAWEYNGQAHSNTAVVAENFVGGEGVVTNGFATITDVGEAPNAFAYAFAEGTKPANYDVTCVTGRLEVTPYAATVAVKVVGHSATNLYNGKEHVLTGYEVVIEGDGGLYGAADIDFNSEAETHGTDPGEYVMGLRPRHFSNTSGNFADVTFDVVDGKLTVVKSEAQQAIEAAFGGFADVTTINGGEDGSGDPTNYLVTVTGDWTSPAVLKACVSDVVIDLNGHSITGQFGTAGASGLPGTDGRPAIVAENAAAKIVLRGSGSLAGGDGGKGNPPGVGAYAIADATGAEVVPAYDPAAVTVARGLDGEDLKTEEQKAIERAFAGGADVKPVPNSSGVPTNYRVTLTNDMEGPVTLAGIVEKAILDLNGHAVVGADGARGTALTPGADGVSAIVASNGLVRLTLEFAEDSAVGGALVGGRGGDGVPFGRGAYAVASADGSEVSLRAGEGCDYPENYVTNGVDGVFIVATSDEIKEALDFTKAPPEGAEGLVFVTPEGEGDWPWIVETDTNAIPIDCTYAMRSGNAGRGPVALDGPASTSTLKLKTDRGGTLAFDWFVNGVPQAGKTPSPENGDCLAFYVDGVNRGCIAGKTMKEAASVSVTLSRGPHELEFVYLKSTLQATASAAKVKDCGWVANFRWEDLAVATGEETDRELNAAGAELPLDFATTDGNWYLDFGADGAEAAALHTPESLKSNETAYVTATVTNAGTLAWSWRTDARDGAWALVLDGEIARVRAAQAANGGWADCELVVLGEGEHEVAFAYTADEDCAGGALDGISFTPAAEGDESGAELADTVFAGDRAGCEDLAWAFNPGDGDFGETWYAQRLESASADGQAMRSGAVGAGSNSVFATGFSGRGFLSFDWNADCDSYTNGEDVAGGARLVLAADGAWGREMSLSGPTQGWRHVEFELGFGDHAVRFSYEKLSEPTNDVADAAWVDNVRWRPDYVFNALVNAFGLENAEVVRTDESDATNYTVTVTNDITGPVTLPVDLGAVSVVVSNGVSVHGADGTADDRDGKPAFVFEGVCRGARGATALTFSGEGSVSGGDGCCDLPVAGDGAAAIVTNAEDGITVESGELVGGIACGRGGDGVIPGLGGEDAFGTPGADGAVTTGYCGYAEMPWRKLGTEADGTVKCVVTGEVTAPLAIPDNLGKVFVDLAGLSVVGSNGVDNTCESNGVSAVVVYHVEEPAGRGVTELSITNSAAETVELRGGNGAYGEPRGGDGGDGLRIAADRREGTTVRVLGENIDIIGGNAGNGSVSPGTPGTGTTPGAGGRRIVKDPRLGATTTFAYDGEGHAPFEALEGYYTLTNDVCATNPGSYRVFVVLAENCLWTEGSDEVRALDWEIVKSVEWLALEAAFGPESAEVVPSLDGDGKLVGYAVTVTTNELAVPVEIPDNAGVVTVDLDGHDLVGAKGADGFTRPGADGGDAIAVVSAEGAGLGATKLVLTNGAEDVVASVVGGAAGNGQPCGGVGGAGVRVATTNEGVTVDVCANVSVIGGAGGAGYAAGADGGAGGAAVDGAVGSNSGAIRGGRGGDGAAGDPKGGEGGEGGAAVTAGDPASGDGAAARGAGGDGGAGQLPGMRGAGDPPGLYGEPTAPGGYLPVPWIPGGTNADGVAVYVLTNDVTAPLSMADYLGALALDLNGHSITGQTGATGTETTPGKDGGSAIEIRSTLSEGPATELAVFDSKATDAAKTHVVGGKGGDGAAGKTNGGDGGAGIRVLSAREGVTVSVGANVVVEGGAGGVGPGDGGLGVAGCTNVTAAGEILAGATNTVAVAEPACTTPFTYDGTPKRPVEEGRGYVLSLDTSATTAGTYTVARTLEHGFTWDGKTGDAALAAVTNGWTIEKAEISAFELVKYRRPYRAKPQPPQLVSVTASGTVFEDATAGWTVSYARGGAETDDFTSAGDITMTVTGTNSIAGASNVTYTITAPSAEQLAIERAFAASAEIDPMEDDEGYATNYLVTVTNDMAGPVVLAEVVTKAIVDLNGHSITGANGTVGTGYAPGGDGVSAVVASNDAVRIAFVGPGSLVGGDGGKGNPPGKGVLAVADTNGAAVATAAFGEGVLVRDGADGVALLPEIDAPVVEFIYDGTERRPVADVAGYVFAGDVCATNAGSYEVDISPDDGFTWQDGTRDMRFVTWRIRPRQITLTSADDDFTYDGLAHSNATAVLSGDGFVAGEGLVTNGFAAVTDLGVWPNAFAYGFLDGTVSTNYAVTCVTGKLTVASVSDAAIRTTVGLSDPAYKFFAFETPQDDFAWIRADAAASGYPGATGSGFVMKSGNAGRGPSTSTLKMKTNRGGTLAFDWFVNGVPQSGKTPSPNNGDCLALYVDGVYRSCIAGKTMKEPAAVSVALSRGPHEIEFVYVKKTAQATADRANTKDGGWVANFVWTELPSASLAEINHELNVQGAKPQLGFEQQITADAGWYLTDGADGLREGAIHSSEALKSNQTVSVSTVVTNAGTLAWSWKTDVASGTWALVVDGLTNEVRTGETGWSRKELVILGTNEHTVAFAYTADEDAMGGALDRVTFTPAGAGDENGEALTDTVFAGDDRSDCDDLVWVTYVDTPDVDSPWYAQRLESASADGQALRSGAVDIFDNTYLETEIEGSGVFSFDWKVDCEQYSTMGGGAKIELQIDGDSKDSISGPAQAWKHVDIPLEFGVHSVSFSYYDFGATSTDVENAGWIDNVRWRPDYGLGALMEAFGDTAKIDPLADKAGYVVTLTNVVTGPVVIPVDLGAVKIDLNSFSICGADGTEADPAGQPALVFADECGAARGPTAVTFAGTGSVKGGKGASGLAVAGDGAAAILADAADGVTFVKDGDGVTVACGDGGDGVVPGLGGSDGIGADGADGLAVGADGYPAMPWQNLGTAADGTVKCVVTGEVTAPLAIPDNLGKFELDLNGHSITGANGIANSSASNGVSAVVVHSATLTGRGATELSLVNFADRDVDLKGGDGAFANPRGGDGGDGLKVEAALAGVTVQIGAKIRIYGGNGGDSEGTGGNGGEGIDGDSSGGSGATPGQSGRRIIKDPTIDAPVEFVYDGTAQGPIPADAGIVWTGDSCRTNYTLSGDVCATNPGSYTVTATLFGNGRWADGSTEAKTLDWTIVKSAEWLAVEAAFQHAKATPTVEGETIVGYAVTVTNGLTAPLEVPDNLGALTVDLKGHGVRGADGEDGFRRPGEAGGDAIVVVACEGEGRGATKLALSDSTASVGTETEIVGGDGGNGLPAGEGGAGVRVESVRAGVVVEVGENVVVRGGRGGDAYADGLDGATGGAGVAGSVTNVLGAVVGGDGGNGADGDPKGGDGGAGGLGATGAVPADCEGKVTSGAAGNGGAGELPGFGTVPGAATTLPLTPERTADGGVVYVLTNDVTAPLQLSDYLGEVVLDLNGHSITGLLGTAGDATTPGADGGDAIVIIDTFTAGHSSTVLTVVDRTATDASKAHVTGGEGGKGNPGGAGGAGIRVTSARAGVVVNVGTNVVVTGGKGGDAFDASATLGDGGPAVDGDLGTNDGELVAGSGAFILVSPPNCTAEFPYGGVGRVPVAAGVGYELSLVTCATNVGSYRVAVTLATDKPYKWANGLEDGSFTNEWEIVPAEIVAVKLDHDKVLYSGTPRQPAVVSVTAGDTVFTNATVGWDVVYRRSGAETTNFTSLGVITVTAVGKGSLVGYASAEFEIQDITDEQRALAAAFGDAAEVSALVDDDWNPTNYLVNVTNDVTGPVVLPDIVNSAIVMLNGHSVTGLAGEAGTTSEPGGDGTPAIVASNMTVRIALVGPGNVRGGDGGAGHPRGAGAFALADAWGNELASAKSGATVESGADGVTLLADADATVAFMYDGTEKRPFAAAEGYVLSGDTCATNAGDYALVVTPGAGCAWGDGTAEATNVAWTVAPRPVTLRSWDGTWTYDGQAHSNAAVTSSGFVGEDGVTTEAPVTITDVGTKPNAFGYAFLAETIPANYAVTCVTGELSVVAATMASDPDAAYPAAGVVPTEPTAAIDPAKPFSFFDTTNCYDGAAHTIDTNALAEAYSGKFGGNEPSFSYALTKDGEYSAEAPAFTDVTVTSVWYKVTAPNFHEVVHPAKVIVTNRCVTLVSGTKLDFTYDGQAHSNMVLEVGGAGFAPGEGVTASGWATVTAVAEGEVENAFSWDFAEGTRPENYDVSVAYGKIGVTAAPADEPDDFAAASTTVCYDGAPHTIDAEAVRAAYAGRFAGVEPVFSYALSEGGEYSAEPPAFVDVTVTSVWFKASAENYVGFVAHSATVTVTNRCLTFSSGSQEWTYDGQAHSFESVELGGAGLADGDYATASGFATISEVGEVRNSFEYAFAEGTKPGNYAVSCETGTLRIVTATMAQAVDPDADLPEAAFDPTDPAAIAEPTWPFSAFDTTGVYDGTAHTIDTNALAEAYANCFLGNAPSFSYALTRNGEYSAEAPAFTDATVTSLWYKVTAPNFHEVVHPAKVIVTNRCVTLESGTKLDFEYDGLSHSYAVLTVGGAGFVAGEGVTTSGWATVTAVAEGEVENAFDWAFAGGTRPENYDVSVGYGTIAVGAKPVAAGGDVVLAEVADAYAYGRDAKEPKPAVSNLVLGTELVEGVDFEYSWADNVDATDSAKVIATFTGDYSGALTNFFPIAPRRLELASATTEWTFDGAWHSNEAVTVAGDMLPDGDGLSVFGFAEIRNVGRKPNSFSYEFAAGTRPGNYVVSCTTGELSVVSRPGTSDVFEFGPVGEAYAYDGTAREPRPTVIDGVSGLALVEGEDFTYAWADNVDATDSAKVIVNLTGNYSGSVTGEFAIARRKIRFVTPGGSWTYDGRAHSNATVQVLGDGFVAGEGILTNGFATVTEVGTAKNAFSYAFLAGTKPGNYEVTAEEGVLEVRRATLAGGPDAALPGAGVDPADPAAAADPAVPFSAFDTTAVYDGERHTLDASALEKAYSNELFCGNAPLVSYALSRDGVYSAMPPTFVDATVTCVWYRVEAANFEDVIHPAKVIVTPREVTLRSQTKTWSYDGKAHSARELEPADFAWGEGVTASGFPEITAAGTLPNAFSYAFQPNTKPENYVVTCVTGALTVAKAAGLVTVRVTGRSATYDFDTLEKSVEGYGFEIDDPAGVYAAEDFAFSGEARVSASDLGKHPMGLAPDQFGNLNANFANVVFEVADGMLEIVKGETQLKIEGAFYDHADARPEVDADGKATNWVAKLNADVENTVALPADVGPLTVDLAGHAVRGTRGMSSSRTEVGGDGQPAFVVPSGAELKVVDTVGGGTVTGGPGGEGNPPGKGGPAAVDEFGEETAAVDGLEEVVRPSEPGEYSVSKFKLYPDGDGGAYAGVAKGSEKFNGVLLDPFGEVGGVMGTVQLTVKAPNKKTGYVDLSAKVVTWLDKQSFTFKTPKGGLEPPTNGVWEVELAGANKKSLVRGPLVVRLDGDSLTGSFEGLEIDGSRDVLSVKARKADALKAVAPFVGPTWSGVFDVDDGTNLLFAAGFSATVKKTGKATVKVLDAEGKTMSCSATAEIGTNGVVALPVLVRKTAKVNGESAQRSFGFRLVFSTDTNGTVCVDAADVSLMRDWVKKTGTNTVFCLPLFDGASPVTVDPKAFKAEYLGNVAFEETLATNVGQVAKNGMKLAKTGFVTGTVKVNVTATGKAVSGKAYGVMVGETGYGVLTGKLSKTETFSAQFVAAKPEPEPEPGP